MELCPSGSLDLKNDIDKKEIENRIKKASLKAQDLLRENWDLVEKLTEQLKIAKTMTSREVNKIIKSTINDR